MSNAGPAGRVGGLLAAGALAVLAAALAAEHLGGLAPCRLCLWQRWPWVAAAGLGALAWRLGRHPRLATGVLALLAAVLLAGAGLGAYHAGVEWGWWPAPGGCGAAGLDFEGSAQDLAEQVMSTPMGGCGRAAWRFLGLSLAGYNALLSLAGAGLAGWAARRTA